MSPSVLAWTLLVIAGLLEVGMALCLGASKNFSRPLASVGFFVFALSSISLLSLALRTLPIGTAYAVWTGIGAAGTVLVGLLFLGEPANAARVFFLGLLIVSVVGLKAVSPH